MPAIPKPQREDKPSFAQWNSTLRITKPIRRKRALGRGGVVCRPKGHRDPRDWAVRATRAIIMRRLRAQFRFGVMRFYGGTCLHPMGDGTLCGQQPVEAHHCRFGGRRLEGDAQQDPRNGTLLCQRHHNGGDDCPHACTTPGQGETRRRHWERFAASAMAEGPEVALRWNRQGS